MIHTGSQPETTLRPCQRRGYWHPLVDEVLAMEPYDLLIWTVAAKEVKTALNKISELRSEELKLMASWCDGKLFVVRMR